MESSSNNQQNRRQQPRQRSAQQQPRQRSAQQQRPANGQRQSVSADAARQQQARRQAAQRQAAREQQQAAHRQQMRDQTMREHQARMQAQRAQGAAAYSTSKYVARNGKQSRRNAADDIRTAAAGGYRPPQGGGGHHARKSHRKRNIIIAVVAAVVVLLLVPTVAFGMSALGARDDANTLMTQGRNMVAQIKAGDMAGAKVSADEFDKTAEKLHKDTDSPLWAAATMLPVYGEDIKQVRALADAADVLAGQVLVPVVDSLPEGGISAIMVDGGINVQAMQNILVPLGASSDAIHECAEKLENTGETHIEQLKSPMSTIKSALSTLDDLSAQATELSNVLPGLLGAQGTRTYLLVACSGAEIRSTGGFPGSAGLMTVTNGKIEIGDFSSPAAAVPNLPDEQKIMVPPEEERIFGKRVTESFFDTTFIPNFPRAAELMKLIWDHYPNPRYEGIICVDPVFLQRILALTGGITTTDGTVVDGTNAAEMLMNTVYIKYPDNNDAQDALFSQVANHALGQVFGNIGSVDIVQFMNTLLNSFKDKRIFMWVSNPNEEAVIQNLGWANAVSTSEIEPETGIYVGCAMGAKIDWYLDINTEVSPGTKNPDGSTSYNVKVTFLNTLSEAQAIELPWYVSGADAIKRTGADMPLDVYLYAPRGGSITNMQTDGYFTGTDYYNGHWNTMPGEDPMTRAEYAGNEVWFGMTQMVGESTTTLTYTVTTSPKATEELALAITPLPNEKLMETGRQ